MSGPIASPAEFLLSRTGDLRLTDAQVTRLAAIARRSAERRQAMRARLDSIRPERGPGMMRDSATRARFRERADQMRPELDRLREQSEADRRDAIAVLTPDQQARAWEYVSAAGRGMGRGGRGPRGMGMGRGFAPRRGTMGPRPDGLDRRRMGPPDGPREPRQQRAPAERRRPD